MATISLAQAQAHLDAWMAADLAVATGQSYTIGSRTLHRTNAKEIRDSVNYWQRYVSNLSRGSGGMRIRYATV